MVEGFLKRVRPDYVQYDCKGHVGYLGYPSKVGTSAPGIVKDSLEIWRRVTERHGVALYIHFSGAWDSLAVAQHPEWALVRADGKRDDRVASTFGPYVDRLMIPQLREAAEKYDLDGAWVDGECWAVRPDYSEAAARAWGRPLPKGPEETGWLEFLDFQREQFRKYVRHYVEELHRARPGFQIASNWLYSTYVPERPELPVDFLSGDYLGNASVSAARLEARYLGAAGQPWDLMAWGFQRPANPKLDHSHKPAVQLQQEASVVLAQGGGFQIYYQPTRAGWLDERHVGVMGKVAEFCRARQALAHRSETVLQIGLLFSRHSLYRTANKMFGGWGQAVDPARGMLDALLENHYSVDVIPDWKLAEVAGRYPLLVVPDWPDVGPEVRELALKGKVLVVGAENAALFADALGVKAIGKASDQHTFITGDEVFGTARGRWLDVEPAGARVLEYRYPTYDARQDGKVAATLHGNVAAIYGPVGALFAAAHAPAMRHFVRRVVEQLFQPAVRLEGPPTVEVALRRKDGSLVVHLVNCTGMQVAGDYAAVDYIPSVGPLRLSVRTARRPRRVTFEPEGRVLAGEWKDGAWSGTAPRLEIHGMVKLEGA
jgi:hypothetical protein